MRAVSVLVLLTLFGPLGLSVEASACSVHIRHRHHFTICPQKPDVLSNQSVLAKTKIAAQKIIDDAKRDADALRTRTAEDADDIEADAQRDAENVITNAQRDADAIKAKATQDADGIKTGSQHDTENLVAAAQLHARDLMAQATKDSDEIKAVARRDGENIVTTAHRDADNTIANAQRDSEKYQDKGHARCRWHKSKWATRRRRYQG